MIRKVMHVIMMVLILTLIFIILNYCSNYFNNITYYIWFIHVISFTVISISIYNTKQALHRAENKAIDKHKQSEIDSLTNVYNRVGFKEYGYNKWQEALDNNSSFVAIFIDIDKFKSFNDTYGHMIGDIVLKETANCLKKCLRLETDIIIRYGGDEFLLLLSCIEKPVVEKLVQRIQNNMNNIKVENVKENITLSFGINYKQKVNKDLSLDEILKASDKALYESKRNGGNQYYFYNE